MAVGKESGKQGVHWTSKIWKLGASVTGIRRKKGTKGDEKS